MLKTCILIALMLAYFDIIYTFYLSSHTYRREFHELYPRFYSVKNPSVITITIPLVKQAESDEELVIPIRNEDFIYKPENFFIDDTDNIKNLGLACQPDSFGYTIEKGNEVYPYKEYPKCSEKNKQNDTYLHIDRKNEKLYMDCPNGENDKYVVGPFGKYKFVAREEGLEGWDVHDYKGPISSKKIEFGLGSCDSDDDSYMQASMSPIFNKTAYELALANKQGKPKLIYILTLDSFSRRHFFRKLPKVVDFMDSLNKNSSFSAFDFKLHNNQGDNSPGNQVPIFSGNVKPKKFQTGFNGDVLGDKALWNILRKKGYVSFIGLEDCDGNFIEYIGKRPNIDYYASQFYCAVEKFTENKFGKLESMQRCIGGHQSHYYLLNYTDNIVDDNLGANLLLYIHLSAAHEYTGQHAVTLNDDLSIYLENFLKKYNDTYDIIIFLNADHGMRYGHSLRDIAAYQERKLPAFFLIASNSLLSQYPYSYWALSTNTQRLVTKIDYRETILHFEGIEESNPYSINLFTEISPKSRTCPKAGINPWECSCYKMIEITKFSPKMSELIESLKDYSENLINSLAYSSPLHAQGKICKKIHISSVSKVFQTGLNNVEEIIKFELESDTHKGMKFSVTMVLASDEQEMGGNGAKFRYENLSFNQYKIKARV